MEINWEPLNEIIETNRRFVLSSHVRPDADAIGSELGMANLLEELDKTVTIVNPSNVPSNLAFLDPDKRIKKLGDGITIDAVCDNDVHIVLDTSAWAQLVDVGHALRKTKAVKVVIDHHVSADDLGALEFKNTVAEATGALVFQFAQHAGIPIQKQVAHWLYCAIATDTGWFRFSSTTSETMRIASQLIDSGAKPHLIYQMLYERDTVARIHLTGHVLARTKVDCNGKLAYICVKQDDFAQTGAVPADTEDLVNECLRIAGAECAFIAIEQKNRQVKVSFRSKTDVNVATIAEQFGGGGHKQAAGAILPGPLADALPRVLTAFTTALDH